MVFTDRSLLMVSLIRNGRWHLSMTAGGAVFLLHRILWLLMLSGLIFCGVNGRMLRTWHSAICISKKLPWLIIPRQKRYMILIGITVPSPAWVSWNTGTMRRRRNTA